MRKNDINMTQNSYLCRNYRQLGGLMELNQCNIKAELTEPLHTRIKELIAILNENIDPPNLISEKDIYIRAMHIVSEEINSYGGMFPIEEMNRLTGLLVNSPVLVGHRKDKLPIGRNFYAEIVEKDGQQWIKSYFYWLRTADGSDSLKENIDGQIYKECSIGFTFNLPECSICHKDIRNCHHEPFKEYSKAGIKTICCFYYKNIEQVLETSLVYRGAVRNTSISNDLCFNDLKKPTEINQIDRVVQLDSNEKYLIAPYYESLEVEIQHYKDKNLITEVNGLNLNEDILQNILKNNLIPVGRTFAFIVGYRGKERCSTRQLFKYLNGMPSSVTRIEFKIIPGYDNTQYYKNIDLTKNQIKPIRFEIVTRDRIKEVSKRLQTKDGVRIWPISQLPPRNLGFVLKINSNKKPEHRYELYSSKFDDKTYIKLYVDKNIKTYVLSNFKLPLLNNKTRFKAERESDINIGINNKEVEVLKGKIDSYHEVGESMRIKFRGALSGTYNLQSVTIKGQSSFLFYKSNCLEPKCEYMK
jgi:hypothetical protein